MDSLPKGIGDPLRLQWTLGPPSLGPTWTHCRKALVTEEASDGVSGPHVGGSDMDSLPKGIGDSLIRFCGTKSQLTRSDMDSLPKGIGDRSFAESSIGI